jgi:citrate synthase
VTKYSETIRSRIWREEAEPDNPFAAAACYCSGYDVYGEILTRASWPEYIYLLFRGERPTREQARLLEALTIALANPGPRDHGVHAAMSGAVGGSSNAACLMAALAVGAGQLGGAREVAIAMDCWRHCGPDLAAWDARLRAPQPDDRPDVWPRIEHPPGFDPHGASCATPVRQTLNHLARSSPGDALPWLLDHRLELEAIANCPLAMSGVAAAALVDLGFPSLQGEMLYLLLRLPGAAAHALEQREFGWKKFPFFGTAVQLLNDPGPAAMPGTRSGAAS